MTTQFLRAGYLVPGLICVFTQTGAAFAQSYPNRVIRVIACTTQTSTALSTR